MYMWLIESTEIICIICLKLQISISISRSAPLIKIIPLKYCSIREMIYTSTSRLLRARHLGARALCIVPIHGHMYAVSQNELSPYVLLRGLGTFSYSGCFGPNYYRHFTLGKIHNPPASLRSLLGIFELSMINFPGQNMHNHLIIRHHSNKKITLTACGIDFKTLFVIRTA